MPRIPEETIEQVRQSVDIVEVVSDHVMLNKRGKSHIGLCPFHDDRSPSFNVSQDKQIYKCFACGEGGNVFTFLTKIEGISFIEAVRKLAQQSGVSLPESRPEDREQQAAFDGVYSANEFARKFYHHLLMEHDAGAAARDYLQGRGVSEEVRATFSLGYAPNAWDGLLVSAGRRGFDPQTLERAGLVLPRRDGNGYYDRFRHRIMFPIQAHTGRTVAFGARALDPEAQAKYLNSPETPVYNKSATLYGLWQSRDAIRSERLALIVEGYMDLIALAQQDVRHAVATAGTALTSNHARLLRRYAERTVLIFDGDAAGTAAAARGIEALFESGLEVRVAFLPEDHDPDSYIREHGREGFGALTGNAAPALDFLISWIAGREDLSTSNGKARATAALAELISRTKDGALRSFLTKETAEKLGVDEGTLIQSIRQAGRRPARTGPDTPPETGPEFDPRPRSERELLTQMMADDAVADAILKQIRIDDFTNGFYRRIAALIASRRQKGQSAGAAVLLDQSPAPDLVQIVSTLSMEVGIANPDQPELPLQDYIDTFKLKNLEARIHALQAEIKSADAGADLKAQLEMLARQKDLTEQRKTLIESRRPPLN